eukprot:2355922-Amphidinium_carterae.2
MACPIETVPERPICSNLCCSMTWKMLRPSTSTSLARRTDYVPVLALSQSALSSQCILLEMLWFDAVGPGLELYLMPPLRFIHDSPQGPIGAFMAELKDHLRLH